MPDRSALDERIKPIVEEALRTYVGTSVADLESSLTDRLVQGFDFVINTTIAYKQAKKQFKRAYVLRQLRLHLGNVAETARVLGVDRRTVHRLIRDLAIPVDTCRKDLFKPSYVRAEALKEVITTVLDTYKPAERVKLSPLYAHVTDMSRTLVNALPEQPMSLKQAEHEFDKRYFAALKNSSNIAAALHARIRPETVHRKMKGLALSDAQY